MPTPPPFHLLSPTPLTRAHLQKSGQNEYLSLLIDIAALCEGKQLKGLLPSTYGHDKTCGYYPSTFVERKCSCCPSCKLITNNHPHPPICSRCGHQIYLLVLPGIIRVKPKEEYDYKQTYRYFYHSDSEQEEEEEEGENEKQEAEARFTGTRHSTKRGSSADLSQSNLAVEIRDLGAPAVALFKTPLFRTDASKFSQAIPTSLYLSSPAPSDPELTTTNQRKLLVSPEDAEGRSMVGAGIVEQPASGALERERGRDSRTVDQFGQHGLAVSLLRTEVQAERDAADAAEEAARLEKKAKMALEEAERKRELKRMKKMNAQAAQQRKEEENRKDEAEPADDYSVGAERTLSSRTAKDKQTISGGKGDREMPHPASQKMHPHQSGQPAAVNVGLPPPSSSMGRRVVTVEQREHKPADVGKDDSVIHVGSESDRVLLNELRKEKQRKETAEKEEMQRKLHEWAQPRRRKVIPSDNENNTETNGPNSESQSGTGKQRKRPSTSKKSKGRVIKKKPAASHQTDAKEEKEKNPENATVPS